MLIMKNISKKQKRDKLGHQILAGKKVKNFLLLLSKKNMSHILQKHLHFMREAIEMAKEGVANNFGGPFGCVIVKNNTIIGRGCNSVLLMNDPTAHAEIVAIRDACNHLKNFQLSDCTIYTTCEPCPMCLGAIYWARPSAVFFANTKADAEAIGFDDSFIYNEMNNAIDKRKIKMQSIGREEAIELFNLWKMKEDKTLY